jgi:Pumilio-family RNA binding repeat
VIDTIKRSPHLISMVISSLNHGVLDLMMDANGSHVTQRCLQHMDPEYTLVSENKSCNNSVNIFLFLLILICAVY